MQDNMKHNNIRIIGIPEGEEEGQGIENLFEQVMMENFPNLRREKSPKSRKHRESLARGTQRGPLQDTLQLKWQNFKLHVINCRKGRRRTLDLPLILLGPSRFGSPDKV